MTDIAAEGFTNAGDIMKFAGAGLALVHERRALGPRRIDVADTGHFLVMHIDQRQRRFGDQSVFSSEHRQRFTDKAHFVQRHHRAVAQTVTVIRIDVAEVRHR